MSIQRFLSWSIALLVFAASAVAMMAAYWQAYHEVDELFDAQLVQHTRVIALLSASAQMSNLDPAVMHSVGPGHPYERYVAIQRWNASGDTLLLSSESAPEKRLAPLAQGLSVSRWPDGVWHVFTVRLPTNEWLMVAENGQARRELAQGSAVAIIAPFLVVIPLVLLLVTWVIRRGLRPLVDLQQAVSKRGDTNLEPLRTSARAVSELAPLELAISGLLDQLQGALAREQRFTADAAHELRTLLTVLKLHADNARTLTDPNEVAESLKQLQSGVERATRMVAQLLDLARVDPQNRGALLARTAVAPAARQVMADLMPLASKRDQSLFFDAPDQAVFVHLKEEALHILLRNLVENALRYSPEQSCVEVRLSVADQSAEISIIDAGSGVSEDMAARVTERFFRGHHDGLGAGLGLSIVARIVELGGGKLAFHPASARPARVTVTLPLA